MITAFQKMIASVRKKDITDTSKVEFVDKCPVSYSSRTCHPSCNWWNGTKCVYPTLLYKRSTQ